MTSDLDVDPPGLSGGDDALVTLVASFVTLLPVDNAAVSTLGSPFDVETLAVSSSRAARLDEAQIDLGEGPAWDAYRARQQVDMCLTDSQHATTWPFLSASPTTADLASIVAIPLIVSTVSIGAVTLSSSTPTAFTSENARLAQNLAVMTARAIMTQAMREVDNESVVRDPALSRREVHQATGMVLSQTGSTPAQALLTLRAHAFASGMTVREVAAQVIARTLTFSDPDPNDRK